MKTSDNGYKLLMDLEGFRDKAYPDSGGVWTIGYGSTINPATGQKVKQGDTITKEKASSALLAYVKVCENLIAANIKVELNQNQYDALICFLYNVSHRDFLNSGTYKLINANELSLAADRMLLWNKVGGLFNKGLAKRRQRERELFLS